MSRSPAVAVLLWLACALAGTCTLGVVALERAAEPLRLVRKAARVALVELGPGAGDADALAFWDGVARAAGLPAERVAAARLEEIPARFDVWLLSDPHELSEQDWSALDAFAARGGGVVLTGLAGVRAHGAGARQSLPLRRLFPGHRFELRRDAPMLLSSGARGPIAAGLPEGALPLAHSGAHLATRTGGALLWGAEKEAGAAVVGLYRGAPAVWLGCPPDWIASRDAALALARNALRYAAREALMEPLFEAGDASGTALAVRSELAAPRDGELQVRARNAGVQAAHDVALRIYLPAGAARPALQAPGWFAARPRVRYASSRAWVELVVRELDPGESVEYTLLF
jgi:hypothetical protein